MSASTQPEQYGFLTGMFTVTAAAALLIASSSPLRSADSIREQPVETHASQGEVKVIEGSKARLKADDDGVYASVETSQLSPGHVHTIWFVAVNNPAACETSPCAAKDVLGRASDVQSDIVYGDGIVVGEDGRGKFATFQQRGSLDGGWLGNGLTNPTGAEIHLVVNDHGPLIAGEEADMLTSYRGGCTEESIPKPFPATARAQGKPGPNTCRLVQVVIFLPAGAP